MAGVPNQGVRVRAASPIGEIVAIDKLFHASFAARSSPCTAARGSTWRERPSGPGPTGAVGARGAVFAG